MRLVFYTDRIIPERFAGLTIGFVVLIRPKYRDDSGLLAHEAGACPAVLAQLWPVYAAVRD